MELLSQKMTKEAVAKKLNIDVASVYRIAAECKEKSGGSLTKEEELK